MLLLGVLEIAGGALGGVFGLRRPQGRDTR